MFTVRANQTSTFARNYLM